MYTYERVKFETETGLILMDAPLTADDASCSNRFREVSGAGIREIDFKIRNYNQHNNTNVQAVTDSIKDITYIYI